MASIKKAMENKSERQEKKQEIKKIIRRATKILQHCERKKSWKSKIPQKRDLYFEINRISTVLN